MNVVQKIWKGVSTLLRLFVRALFCLIPRSRKRLVFSAWAGKRYDDNSRVLFEYCLQNRPDLKCMWITSSEEVQEAVRRQGLPVCNSRSREAFRWLCRSRYIVCTDSPLDYGRDLCTGGARIINLWHGVGPKAFGLDVAPTTGFGLLELDATHFLSPTYFVSTSEEISKRYVQAKRVAPQRVLNLGQARNDIFYSAHVNPLRERFPGLKIVVYMPTFRQEGKNYLPMDLEQLLDLDAIQQLCERCGMVFLVKFHQWTVGRCGSGRSRIIPLEDNDLRVQMVLDAADILVTDYSSCFVDHLLLDRPQLFFAYDLDHYLSCERNMYTDFRTFTPGRICIDGESLVEELERLSKGSDDYAERRREIRDFYYSPHNQQPVAASQVDAILKL